MTWRAVCSAALAMIWCAAPSTAQHVRATGSTSLSYVELRTLARDSIGIDHTDGAGLLRQLADGRIVRCIPGEDFCHDVRAGPVVSSLPAVQDLDVSVWGFGTGMRAFAQLRGRTTVAGDHDLWPRSEDPLDVLSLYGEIERNRLRVRIGRQWLVSGLGFYNFDGVDIALRALRVLSVEAYGGRSLVRGLNEGRSGALESVEALSNPATGVLFGVNARYRPDARLAVSALYQITDRLPR
jgi:hypothetical protein